VQAIKCCLRKVIGKAKLTYDKQTHLLTGDRTLGLPDGQLNVDYNGDEDFTINQQDLHE